MVEISLGERRVKSETRLELGHVEGVGVMGSKTVDDNYSTTNGVILA
jgi:hypothetical protein